MLNAECRALLFFVVLSGCSSPEPKREPASLSLDALYGRAVEELRRGDLESALILADRGRSGTLDRPESESHLRFQLLQGEILLFRRSPSDAERFIATSIPDTSPFAALRAR